MATKRKQSSREKFHQTVAANIKRRKAQEQVRLGEILRGFPSADALAREILRLRRNETGMLSAVLMSRNGERITVMGPGPIGADAYKLGCRVQDDFEKSKQLI